MNEKQWKLKQDEVAREQKQKAREAKMKMLGVEPKPPKPKVSDYHGIIGFDPGTFKFDVSWPTVWSLKPEEIMPYFEPVNIELKVDTFLFTDAMVTVSKQMMQAANSISAFGTAYSGAFASRSVVSQLAGIVPAVTTHFEQCPGCGHETGNLASLIPHINDHHKWSRERIADWLDSLDVDLTVKPIDKETNGTVDAEEFAPVAGDVLWFSGAADNLYGGELTGKIVASEYGLATWNN